MGLLSSCTSTVPSLATDTCAGSCTRGPAQRGRVTDEGARTRSARAPLVPSQHAHTHTHSRYLLADVPQLDDCTRRHLCGTKPHEPSIRTGAREGLRSRRECGPPRADPSAHAGKATHRRCAAVRHRACHPHHQQRERRCWAAFAHFCHFPTNQSTNTGRKKRALPRTSHPSSVMVRVGARACSARLRVHACTARRRVQQTDEHSAARPVAPRFRVGAASYARGAVTSATARARSACWGSAGGGSATLRRMQWQPLGRASRQRCCAGPSRPWPRSVSRRPSPGTPHLPCSSGRARGVGAPRGGAAADAACDRARRRARATGRRGRDVASRALADPLRCANCRQCPRVLTCAVPCPAQPAHKTFKVKKILAKKARQNRQIPQWIRLRTDNKIR